jgi:hypothetical protein
MNEHQCKEMENNMCRFFVVKKIVDTMPIQPSVAQSYKHLILLQRYIYLNLSLRVYY